MRKVISLFVCLMIVSGSVLSAASAESGSFAIGDIITFGQYEQDDNKKDGKEAISWIVLDVDRNLNRALILSLYGLEEKPFDKKYADTTWEKCSLRKWLNRDFYESAFSKEEKKRIQSSHVDNSSSQQFYLTGGLSCEDTTDKLFLLSYAEAWKYFDSDEARLCEPTKSTAAHKNVAADRESGKPACCWWLRSYGGVLRHAMYVSSTGDAYVMSVSEKGFVVRPACWIDL